MSYLRVIRHLESILNGCGDPVRFTPTGRKLLNATATRMAVEVLKVDLLRVNDCFTLPPPVPAYAHHRNGLYAVNIIQIPPAMAEAYSNGRRYPDEELETVIRTEAGLFSCYLLP